VILPLIVLRDFFPRLTIHNSRFIGFPLAARKGLSPVLFTLFHHNNGLSKKQLPG